MILKERTFLYAVGSKDGPCKIGITQNIGARLRMLQTGSAQKLELIFVYSAYDKQTARSLEKWFHNAHAEYRLTGEWFDCTADEAFEWIEGIIDLAYSTRDEHSMTTARPSADRADAD